MVRRLLCACLGVAAACTASAVDVAPPRYQLYFPTGMAISPDERWLFVLSANSDLRYSAGAVQVIDLDKVDAIADAWQASPPAAAGPECRALVGRPQVLGCPMTLDGGDPAPFVVGGASVAVGNFGVSLGVQQLESGGAPTQTVRVFATVRGDPSVTWMDFDGATGSMSCGGSGDFPRCAETHRLARLRNDATLAAMPSEPFTLHVAGEHVFVTHFTTGFLSLISAPLEVGGEPMLQDVLTGLWIRSQITGGAGAAGVAARPGDPSGLVYVTSRQEARVALVSVAEAPPDDQGRPVERLVRSRSFYLSGLESAGQQGDARDLRFSADGDRAWIVNRLPPSLQLYDTSLDGDGAPRNQLLGALELCDQPASLAIADFGEGEVAVVPCFSTGVVWMVDPMTLRILTVEQSGRGPNAVAVSPRRKKIYVANYAEDTLSVLDATPGSARQYRTIVRLGNERPIQEQH